MGLSHLFEPQSRYFLWFHDKLEFVGVFYGNVPRSGAGYFALSGKVTKALPKPRRFRTSRFWRWLVRIIRRREVSSVVSPTMILLFLLRLPALAAIHCKISLPLPLS